MLNEEHLLHVLHRGVSMNLVIVIVNNIYIVSEAFKNNMSSVCSLVLHIFSCAVKIYQFINCDQKVTEFIYSIDIHINCHGTVGISR